MTQNAEGRTKNKNEIEKEKRTKRGMQNAKVASRISYNRFRINYNRSMELHNTRITRLTLSRAIARCNRRNFRAHNLIREDNETRRSKSVRFRSRIRGVRVILTASCSPGSINDIHIIQRANRYRRGSFKSPYRAQELRVSRVLSDGRI